jgi:hypothetical protein
VTPASRQLADELGQAAWRVGVVCSPDAALGWQATAAARAPHIVAALESRDVAEAAGVATDLMVALWPDGDPPSSWWTTPLGLIVARASPDGLAGVTQQKAADILGVTRGTVAQLVHRGVLRSTPSGVVMADVLARLVRP